VTGRAKSGRGAARDAATPFGMDLSIAVFDRATLFAKGLFPGAESTIILVKDGKIWRSRYSDGSLPPRDALAEQVIATGEPIWIENADNDPRLANLPIVAGPPYLKSYIATPIRLADGATPGVLAVVGTTPLSYDEANARRLAALAEFVADEWARAQIAEQHAQSAKALEATQTTLEALVAAVPIALVLTDRDLRVVAASAPWARSLGLKRGAYLGRTLYELAPSVYERSRKVFDRALAGEASTGKRIPTVLPIGMTVWLNTELKPWRTASGEIGGVVLTANDVTEIVEALDRSERSEERLTLAMELAELHVWEMDYVRRELIKVGAEDTFFEEPQTYDKLAQDIWQGVDPRDRPTVEAVWERHIRAGERYNPIYRIPRGDGREIWAQGAAKLFTREDGRPLRLVGALQNMTARKAAEAELIQARNAAEAANTAKSTFLATMSHEIRTPLNGVLGMAQAMAADELSDVQRERLEVVRQSGESLLAVLNDVLDLSKIEAGRLELEQVDFDLRELAKGAHAAFTAIAGAQGLGFDLTVEPAALGVYRGDPTRVRQILYNLISNALKFTEQGDIRVTAGWTGEALVFTVSDTGIGIAPERLSSLFQRFEQADASTSRRYGGTGLGLAICRQLTELMDGEITAASEAGAGSIFTVTLPLPKVSDTEAAGGPRAASPPAPAAPGQAPRVLAAEDNEVNQLVLRTLLRQAGIDPVIVANGRDAIAAWEAGDWDVILMDVQMPDVDGPTAARAIRAREAATGRPRTPIVALTANAMSHQVAEYQGAGMDGFVAKPIEVGRLFAALEEALSPTAADEAATG
jgi:PAS domain S-box-containing protein